MSELMSKIRDLSRPDESTRFMNKLHDIVARRCPKNKAGAPVVSDFDKLTATPEEMEEAMQFVREKRKAL